MVFAFASRFASIALLALFPTTITASPISAREAPALQCNTPTHARTNALALSSVIYTMTNLNQEYHLRPGANACCHVPGTAGTHNANFALCNGGAGEGPLVTRGEVKSMAAQVSSKCAPGPAGNLNGVVYAAGNYNLVVSGDHEDLPTCGCAGDAPDVSGG